MTAWTHGIALVAAMGFVLPAAAQQIDPQKREQIEHMMMAYGANIDKKDAAAVAAFYTDDAVVLSPTSPTMVVKSGKDEITKYLQTMFDREYKIEGKTTSITPLGDDAAIVLGEYHATGKTSAGHEFNVIGYWSAVDVLNSNSWKIRLLTAFPAPRE